MKYKLHTDIAFAGISHHNSDISELEKFRFEEETDFLNNAREHFKGVVLLQTCNRIEIFVQGDAETLKNYLTDNGRTGFWLKEGCEALKHLLYLAAGMDSMIVGEDQILGQLRKSLAQAQEAGTSCPVLDLCITKAVHAGIEVRKRTNINNGAVSIGSAAVKLAEELIGTLSGKHILVVGGGEMGKLVAQALSAKELTAIYVTNRTFKRAKILAEEIGGKAVMMDELYHYISLSDVVISCTGAPHPVIKTEPLKEALDRIRWPLDETKRPLILIDIAQPRDIEEKAGDINSVKLFTIDDLKSVSNENMRLRRKEAENAEKFLLEEHRQFISLINRAAANEPLADLHTWAEAIRVRERDRAVSRIGKTENSVSEVIDDLTKVLVKKLLSDATVAVRGCAESGDIRSAENLVLAITRGRTCTRKED
ncbi:glutamyl-tRNA reductase [Methanoplanus endosymbiosus]|uniref:Glutamyl-tRNA reductase n=1 Tax=Methanoplanus endosymbiosus TaxID=33865 RepID=A0A9E7PP52_9EURY|nr:glutamyl-tRNA reductase [Methanoplanus endosymbiosus]UUX92471.1 glutamyl-tRNA reductase [Methanoplanus endosymbiosus]